MILTDKNIRELVNISAGNSLIDNFREEFLQSESYDLSIGDEIYRFKIAFALWMWISRKRLIVCTRRS